MARARNKVARLSRELRQVALNALLDGATYAETRAELAAAGVGAEAMPSDSSFQHYQEGSEFAEARQAWMGLRKRAEENAVIASAIGDGGLADAADVVLFEAIRQGMVLLQAGDGDPGRIARAMVAIRKAAQDDKVRELKTELARLKSDLASRAEGEGVQRGLSEATLEEIEARLNLL